MSDEAQTQSDGTASAVPTATRSIWIDAPPERVWADVGNIEQLGAHSPETTGTEWLGDATELAVGAIFRGHNTQGGYDWSTDCTITTLVHGKTFSFGVDWDDHDQFSSVWTYAVAAKDGGTELTESYESAYLADSNRKTKSGREDKLVESIYITLGRIKASIEDA